MKSLIAFIFLALGIIYANAQNNTTVEAKINTVKQGNFLTITAFAHNSTLLHQDLNYILISLKQGKTGTSNQKQTGKFTLLPDESKKLSEASLRIDDKDAVKIFLLVKDNETEQLVGKDSLLINASTFDSKPAFIPESRIELPGLTVDDTKTRAGQIFYEAFIKKYSLSPSKPEGAVTISEVPAFGRSSRIMISQDDQTVYAFMAKPDEEFLEQEAAKTLSILLEIQKRNSFRNREFKY